MFFIYGENMVLEKELETYQKELPSMLGQEGKFVLIHNGDRIGVFGTYEDALKEGYRDFGLEPFLVKQIHATEQVQYITRLFDPCHI
jgi:hypothetical protein